MRFVPERKRHDIEWRVKVLPTYLLHDSQEKLDSLCFYLDLNIHLHPQSFHELNSNDRQYLLKLNPEFSVIVIRCSMPFGNLTYVLRTHFKEIFDVLFTYSFIKRNDEIPACKI